MYQIFDDIFCEVWSTIPLNFMAIGGKIGEKRFIKAKSVFCKYSVGILQFCCAKSNYDYNDRVVILPTVFPISFPLKSDDHFFWLTCNTLSGNFSHIEQIIMDV